VSFSFRFLTRLFESRFALGAGLLALSACEMIPAESTVDISFRPGVPGGTQTAPVAENSSIGTHKNLTVSSTLRAFDGNPADTLSYSIVTPPAKGTVVLTNAVTGAFTFTPSHNLFGSDSFSFRANDGQADSNVAIVTITIQDTFRAPVAPNLTLPSLNEDVPSGLITLSYSDLDDDLASECTISNLQNLSLTSGCSCTSTGVCSVQVVGDPDFYGLASFDYTVTAAGELSNTASASVTVNPVNDGPTISEIADASTNEDTAKSVNFTLTDVDNTLACTGTHLSLGSTNTALVPNENVVWSGTAPDCTATINPAADGHGSATLTLAVTDGLLSGSEAFVLTITRLADDAWTSLWPFDALSDALYSLSNPASIDLSGGVARLTAKDQTDDDNACTGFGDNVTSGCGGSFVGATFSTLQDGSSGVKLGTGGGCDGSSTNCSELDSSWTPQWASLVSYWKMNGAWTDSKGSNHGTSAAGAAFTTSPKLGSHAGSYGASASRTVIPNHSSLQMTSGLTILMWIRPTASITNAYTRFLEKSWSTSYNFASHSATNSLMAELRPEGAVATTGANVYTSGEWTQIGLTFDKTLPSEQVKLYVNGIVVGTGTKTTDLGTDTTDISLGSCSNGTGCYQYDGLLDDVAVWNVGLTASDIQSIYARQSPKYAGVFTSRLMDIGASNAWSTFSWFPTLPFLKELPDAACPGATCVHANNESSTDYPSLVGSSGNVGDNNLMSGIVGLWHLNETAATAGASNDFKDDSGQGRHVDATGGVTFGTRGRLGNAATFNGTTGYVGLGHAGVLDGLTSASHTFSAWAKVAALPTTTCAANTSTCNGSILMRQGWHLGLSVGNNGKFSCQIWNSTGTQFEILSSVYPTGAWHHLTMAVDDVAKKLYCYIDGVQMDSSPLSYTGTLRNYAGYNYTIGFANTSHSLTTGSYAYPFNGSIDEVAMWSRALTEAEARQLYQRGAARLKFQTRACAASPCNESTETWKGPDGSSGTYFSELNNNTVQMDGSGHNKPGLPSMSLTAHTGRYFQYRAILESEDASIALGPELKKTYVGPDHYDSSAPTIGNASPIDFQTLTSFSSTASCASNERFVVSADNGASWQYFDGSAWLGTDGATYSQSSTSAQMSSGAASLSSGTGNLLYRAFLKSDGQSSCSINGLDLGGMK